MSAEDERTKLRLICNLKPSNACQRMIAGDLELLPCTTQWNGVQLEEYEMLLLSSSDRQCFFYVFSMPRVWRGGMALRGSWPRELFPSGLAEITTDSVSVAIRALPMGWLSAVGICQHAQRNLLRRELQPRGKPALNALVEALRLTEDQDFFDWSREVRGDRALPQRRGGQMRSSFQIYIDNRDEYEIIPCTERA